MTTPTAYRFSSVRGRTIRITKLDACGVPVGGAASQIVQTGFVTVKKTKNMDAGTEIKIAGADDTIKVYSRGRQTLLDYGIEVDFAVSDTAGLPLMSGDAAVLDWQAAVAGWEELGLTASGATFALELWTGTAGTACAGSSARFGYWVWPFIENAYIDADDVTNAATNFMIKANTKAPNGWGKGPYTVVAADTANTPSRLLVAMNPNAHMHFEVTTIAPPAPAAAAGPQTFTLPTPY